MSHISLDADIIKENLLAKVVEVTSEPEQTWSSGFKSYAADDDGSPLIRLGMVNFSLDTDLWQGLRGPSLVGRHPLTPQDIWNHYAANNIQRVRADGLSNLMAMPETYEEARDRFGRVVIISAMLGVNPDVYARYADKIDAGDPDPYDLYAKATGEVLSIIDRAANKLALSLMEPSRAVVPMTGKSTEAIINNTRACYQKDKFHGPCNNNWPQNSIAVLTGLLRFGVHRLPFRDEATKDGQVRRIYGRYRSLVIFDQADPVDAPAQGMRLLDAASLAKGIRINDYSRTDPNLAGQRYCTYNLLAGENSACAKCIRACPSGALANSSPRPDGGFNRNLTGQKHRFDNGRLKFDFNNCTSDRYQKANIYGDYVCARCEAICAAKGIRKKPAEVALINQG
jgi:ferredoxin